MRRLVGRSTSFPLLRLLLQAGNRSAGLSRQPDGRCLPPHKSLHQGGYLAQKARGTPVSNCLKLREIAAWSRPRAVRPLQRDATWAIFGAIRRARRLIPAGSVKMAQGTGFINLSC